MTKKSPPAALAAFVWLGAVWSGVAHAAVAQLAGPDLERLARQIAAAERERESEAAIAPN